jgi:tetratricopeptide (TPR) repeat protein
MRTVELGLGKGETTRFAARSQLQSSGQVEKGGDWINFTTESFNPCDGFMEKLLLFGCALACIVVATQANELILTDGKKLTNITVNRVEADGLVITTDSGIEKIPISELSQDTQVKYGYVKIEKAPEIKLPDFYGVYILDQETITRLEPNTNRGQTQFSTHVQLVVYDRRLTNSTGKPEELIKTCNWRYLGDKAHEQFRASFKPIGNKPGMVMLVPTEPWKRGLYSVDIKGTEYQFGIEVADEEKFWREVIAENPRLWQAHNHLGAVLFMKSNHSEALEHFAAAVKLNPKNPESHNNLGLALATQGKLDEAIAQYREALRFIEDASMRVNLANALGQQKRFQEAVIEYSNALKLDPRNAAAHCNRGYTLIQLNRDDEAIEELKKTLEIDPKMQPAQENLDKLLKWKQQRGGQRSPPPTPKL